MCDWICLSYQEENTEDTSTYPKQQKLDRNLIEIDDLYETQKELLQQGLHHMKQKQLISRTTLATRLSLSRVLVAELEGSYQDVDRVQLNICTKWKNSLFSVWTTVTINLWESNMQIENQLYYQQRPFKIALALRKDLFQAVNRLNKRAAPGYYFCICPHTGSLKQRLRGFMFKWTTPSVREPVTDIHQFWVVRDLLPMVTAGLQNFFSELPRLLHICNAMEQHLEEEWPKRQTWKQLDPKLKDHLSELLAQVEASTMPYQLFEKCTENMWPQEYRMAEISDLRKMSQIYRKKILDVTQNVRLEHPKDKLDVFMKVNIASIAELPAELNEQSANARITLANVRFEYEAIPKEPFSKKLLMKEISTGQAPQRRFQNERQILAKIAICPAIYVSKYYYDQNHPNRLFMNFAPEFNLQRYLNKFSKVVSLTTKLFVLYSLIRALLLLKDKDVVHADVSQDNVLIGRSIVTKLKNFGLSSYKGRRIVECRPDLTPRDTLLRLHSNPSTFTFLPVEPANMYSHKQDIYQLGGVIYEMIFGRSAAEMPQEQAEQYLASKWFEQLTLRTLCPQQFNLSGPSVVVTILARVALKCLHRQPEQRPELQWLAILFKTLMSYLDTLY